MNTSSQKLQSQDFRKPKIITIDGPAASGKSTLSRNLAQALGWSWVSTGAFYRALAWLAQDQGVLPTEVSRLVQLSQSSDWQLRMEPQGTHVYFKGLDITEQIAQESVGSLASKISQVAEVRKQLLEAQRNLLNLAKGGGLIAEGRDCGTVVFPDAELKLYLTANQEDRAMRRASEQGLSFDATQRAQELRDREDKRRLHAPLVRAENAILVDTSGRDFSDVLAEVRALVRDRLQI